MDRGRDLATGCGCGRGGAVWMGVAIGIRYGGSSDVLGLGDINMMAGLGRLGAVAGAGLAAQKSRTPAKAARPRRVVFAISPTPS